ncbi:MAG: SDR family NAD(P)-dependent oxidoreductase [Brachybacterium sp.]|uniref:SDR family NAD(P)-dependent oxidoreductase n=1 Tax=Brachybacterium sp. TaxID=1891286 RepID=UPI003F8EB0E0
MNRQSVGNALETITRLSKELGSDPTFVLHGGGNTSIKGTSRDVTGAEVETIWVKGSGWDLATIEPAGFAPLRRERLLEVLACDSLTDAQMVNELRQASLESSAPTASIEALLHAYIPSRVVLHSHADAIVALTNQPDSEARVLGVLGDRLMVLPYVKPGFDLALQIAARSEIVSGDIDAIVLSNHGLFTFSDDPEEALTRHRELVATASAALSDPAWGNPGEDIERRGDALEIAAMRRDLSAVMGSPAILHQSASARAAEYAARSGIEERSSRGTATAEHVIHTKRVPQIGRDVQAYAKNYRRYVDANAHRIGDVTPLDGAPRVIFDPEWGMLTAGTTTTKAGVARDIALHTMDIIDAADRATSYTSFGEEESFDVEYWSLEQAKLRSAKARPEFEGEVAVVVGAATEIGRACAELLLAQGAAVVGVDASPDVTSQFSSASWHGVSGDAQDTEQLARAAETAAREFGGVDVLVVATGEGSVARTIDAVRRYLALAPRGGRVVVVSHADDGADSESVESRLADDYATDGIRVNDVELVYSASVLEPVPMQVAAAVTSLSSSTFAATTGARVRIGR